VSCSHIICRYHYHVTCELLSGFQDYLGSLNALNGLFQLDGSSGQRSRKVLWDGAHAVSRQGRCASAKGSPDKLKNPTGSGQCWLQKYTTEKGREETRHHGIRKVILLQDFAGRLGGAPHLGAEVVVQCVSTHAPHSQLVSERADRTEQGLNHVLWPTKEITHQMKVAAIPNERPRVKRHKIQHGIVQGLARFRVAGQKYLESAVELKTFDEICADTPTDAVGGFKYCAGDS
jgi:hypothetical protein